MFFLELCLEASNNFSIYLKKHGKFAFLTKQQCFYEQFYFSDVPLLEEMIIHLKLTKRIKMYEMPYFRSYFLIGFSISIFTLFSCQTTQPFLATKIIDENYPVVKLKTLSGEEVAITKISGGELGLYRRMIPISEANLYDPFFPATAPDSVAQFYIGYDLVERVGAENFEYIIKREMADAPLIMENLGKKGFRYENLPSMVFYYNNFYGDGESLEVLSAN